MTTRKLMTAATLCAAMVFTAQPTFAEDAAERAGERAGRAIDRTADSAADATKDAANSAAQAADSAADTAAQATDSAADSAQAAAAKQAGQQDQDMDQMFLRAAAISNLFEIQSAKIAQQKAQDQNVKQVAQQLMKDHTQANQQLQQAAQSMQAQLPQQLDAVHQAMLQELQQKPQGQAFDRYYLYGQVAGHVKSVLKYRDASTELQNQQLKQYATQTLPKIRQHLEHMQQIAQYDQAQTAGARESGSSSDQSTTPGGGDRQDPAATPGSQQDQSGTSGDAAGAGRSQ